MRLSPWAGWVVGGGWWVAKLHGQRIILGVMRLAFPLLFPLLFPFPFPHSHSQQRGTRIVLGFGFPKNPTDWSPIQEAYRPPPPTLLILA